MKTAKECGAWLDAFLLWKESAPEGCEYVRPLTGYAWTVGGCSQQALDELNDQYGGSMTITGGGGTCLLEFNYEGEAFRFTNQPPR